MVLGCGSNEFSVLWQVINDGAHAYQDAIPQDCWRTPYMREEELHNEIQHGVEFFAYEQEGQILGVMGLQRVEQVALIRHAYVRTIYQRRGIGGKLLSSLLAESASPLLVGTWAAATWAISFYEKHGFQLVDQKQRVELLKKYWSVPSRQIEASVVLVYNKRPRM